ncbi:hypothetical protein GCM10009863_68020 [Streptomyces axinellae]|uniref:Uncharacterized protein n=1 Tax=Streptomyces axinellae TaxID=552788 RepID=A0ABP6DHL4_9ACTN
MEAMLHARLARAHTRAGQKRATTRAQGTAFAPYNRARDENPAYVYWVDQGELHSRLEHDEPRQAPPGPDPLPNHPRPPPWPAATAAPT